MKDWLSTEDVENIAREALDAACLHIQNALGVETGDLAGEFFMDGMAEHILQSYIRSEIYANKILFEDDEGEVRYMAKGEA